jgi:hypothetical protein
MRSQDQIAKEIASRQTHCYTCGKKLTGYGAYECHVCHEWQCSKECLEKHTRDMKNI